MNKNSGELMLGGEFIGSRSKTLSRQKSGNEGLVSDAISDSHVGCLFGMM
jgi:hypothetical protein